VHCIVTAGPTFEPLDAVRRLTNFSTGSLGTRLAAHLAAAGARVTLLRGVQSTVNDQPPGVTVVPFTTTADLLERLTALQQDTPHAIFHAAAVSDFQFGRVWEDAERTRALAAGKLSTRSGSLFAELVPTPKLLPQLRGLHPGAVITGWKYEVDGDRAQAVQRALRQIEDCRTDACVVNGPAFGEGFGILRRGQPLATVPDAEQLFAALGTLKS
jgi:phosphopantothenoylcysteine synthetase/decarboxylase